MQNDNPTITNLQFPPNVREIDLEISKSILQNIAQLNKLLSQLSKMNLELNCTIEYGGIDNLAIKQITNCKVYRVGQLENDGTQ